MIGGGTILIDCVIRHSIMPGVGSEYIVKPASGPMNTTDVSEHKRGAEHIGRHKRWRSITRRIPDRLDM